MKKIRVGLTEQEALLLTIFVTGYGLMIAVNDCKDPVCGRAVPVAALAQAAEIVERVCVAAGLPPDFRLQKQIERVKQK